MVINNVVNLACPVCCNFEKELLLTLGCGNIDGSRLYPTLKIVSCSSCGHVYNDLSLNEIAGLVDYYNNEYALANLNSVVTGGDLPGSTGKFTHNRYTQLYQVLSPFLKPCDSILDVGCAMGGFLDFLWGKGFSNLYGVEMTEAYVEKARQKKQFIINHGTAEMLPYDNDTFGVVVVEQVLEHLVNPAVAFREAGRVLKKGGLLCIGVPDASRYNEYYFFDYYWLLLREHIQHFDIRSLMLLAIKQGFELIGFQQGSHAVMGDKMIMPNLCALFKYTGQEDTEKCTVPTASLTTSMRKYIAREKIRLYIRQLNIKKLIQSQQSVIVWGCGREFLYLYEAVGLKQCNLTGVIDMNPYKQKNALIRNLKISTPDILINADIDSVLIITATAHNETIVNYVNDIGYRGRIMEI